MQRDVADVMNVPIEAEQIVQHATSIHQNCIYSIRTSVVASPGPGGDLTVVIQT